MEESSEHTQAHALSLSGSLPFLHTHRAHSTHARRVISPVVWSGSCLPGRGANNNRGEWIDSRCSTFSWFLPHQHPTPVRAQLVIERGEGFQTGVLKKIFLDWFLCCHSNIRKKERKKVIWSKHSSSDLFLTGGQTDKPRDRNFLASLTNQLNAVFTQSVKLALSIVGDLKINKYTCSCVLNVLPSNWF